MAQKLLWHCLWQDADERFLAYGSDVEDMPVYALNDDGELTDMRFPGCTNFFPYAEALEGPTLKYTEKQIRERWELDVA